MFPFLLALLFILKIRLGVQSNILEFIKKRYGGEGKKLFRTYEADDVNCFSERNYSEHMKLMMSIVLVKRSIKYSCSSRCFHSSSLFYLF